MEHDLINTIVIGIVAAFICGMIARKLNLPELVGYLIAGVLVGPYTPGFNADPDIAKQLAEIGVILLMFGVGLHFSVSDLLKVRRISVPGAIFQMAVATGIGWGVMALCGYDWITGLIFGFSLSVASTVVLLRTLESRNAVDTEAGKIAVGWLIVEDLAIVFALVLFPTLADMMEAGGAVDATVVFTQIFYTVFKVGVFIALMLFVGRKVLPWLLRAIAKTKSTELTTLGTLAMALGFSFVAYTVFDASFALGAFLAGLVLSESKAGGKVAEKSLPMRDAFAVLFFVSVGMLFDPMTLWEQPVMVLITLLVIIVGKGLAAYLVTHLFGQPKEVSYTIAISLAQIGEFSFILMGLALTRGLLEQDVYNLILAGALLSIALNPLLFKMFDRVCAGQQAPRA